MSKKLWNVKVEVVGLVWADDETEAINMMRARASDGRVDALPGGSAFVSEPLPEYGWNGDET